MSAAYAWACTYPPDYNFACPIATESVRNRRELAQAEIGQHFRVADETPAEGWRRAYRRGFRCTRVVIRLWGA